MRSKEALLRELSETIRGYISAGKIWSHFSDTNGTTRAVIVKIFIESDGNINSEDIRVKVVNDIDRELTEKEIQLFDQIQTVWREWLFIREVYKNPKMWE